MTLLTISRRAFVPLLLLIAAAPGVTAELRWVRYRLTAPAVDTAARVEVLPHAEGHGITIAAEPIKLPGDVSRFGLFVPPGEWSNWRRLPDPPVWGTFTLRLRGADPLRSATADVQVATFPDDKSVVRTMTIATTTGGGLSFVVPANVLANPEQVESVEEGIVRRRGLAESVAVPEGRRPKLLSFSPAGVRGDPTVADSGRREFETAALLGFNTADVHADGADAVPAFRFRSTHETGRSAEHDAARFAAHLAAAPDRRPPLLYSVLVDEPGWQEGFTSVWKQTGGVAGFRAFLREQNVDPKSLGLAALDDAPHLDRRQPVAADAPAAQRRLWYWSCRYTYDLTARFMRQLTDVSRATLPDSATTVNFSDHTVILGKGTVAGGGGPDFFSLGRQASLGMYWSEDWMFWKFTTWGNGLYQRVPYVASLMRGAARLHQDPPNLGYYVVSVGYNPSAAGVDRTVAVRVLLLLGRGVKTFSFFNYGPTARGTIDFWADDAPVVRGVADAIGLVGDPVAEPLLHAGRVPAAQTSLIHSTTAEYWQAANAADADNHEKQYLYAMLGQRQVPVDVVDAPDLPRFINDYKAAYLVDRNLPRASAHALRKWVEGGGVLALWPRAGTLDEFNDPLEVLSPGPGEHAVGGGRVVRFPDRVASLWWDATKKLGEAAGSDWPSDFDDVQRERATRPALEMAKIARPVTVSAPAVTADALVSEAGVAVPLVNLRGTRDEHGTRYLNLRVTLADADGISRAYSARCGELKLRRQGRSATVVTPLDSTDVLVFLRH